MESIFGRFEPLEINAEGGSVRYFRGAPAHGRAFNSVALDGERCTTPRSRYFLLTRDHKTPALSAAW
jgi:hypothetical protein